MFISIYISEADVVPNPSKPKKWLFEKYSTGSLGLIIPLAFIYQVPATEYLLVFGLQLHLHQWVWTH